MTGLKLFIIRHGLLLKFFAVAGSAVVAAIWAVLTFVYPDFILPRFDKGNLEVQISASPKGETDEANIWSVLFKQANTGKRRLYIPASYFYVRAFRFTDLSEKDNLITVEEAAESKRIRAVLVEDVLARKTLSEKNRIGDEAVNYIFYKNWEEIVRKGNLQDLVDVRSGYGPRAGVLRGIHFGQVNYSTNVLEPGEWLETEILVAVPKKYQAIQVDHAVAASKDSLDEVIIGFPGKHGVLLVPFANGPDLEERLSKVGDDRNKDLSGLDERFYKDRKESLFYVKARKQFFVGKLTGESVVGESKAGGGAVSSQSKTNRN